MSVQSYRDLAVWKKSLLLVKEVYALTDTFPKNKGFSLRNQIEKSVISIPSNIAEGRARTSTREFIRFIDIAYGSLAELETQLIIAGELGYVALPKVKRLLEQTAEIGRMLNGLDTALRAKLSPVPRPLIPEPL